MAVSQNEALLVAVFRQLAMKKLDYELLGRDLGLSRQAARKAARNRWVRFEAKIMQSANCNTAAPDNRDPAMPQSPPQTPSPKKKNKAGTAKAKIPNVKKRNRAMSEGSDDVGLHNKRGSEVQPEVEFGEYIEAETKLDEDAGIAALLDGEI
ncbi:hypothetical protein IFR04_004390 [Cadophora malorum]|uniref:Uncharacterized protein n=1 Tax=Cadophora malorum TaxID=108018 RepID=A0A8H7WCT8_9HELO|nr:hypothetical protein IFR04_004390 [Cadophora malorum]